MGKDLLKDFKIGSDVIDQVKVEQEPISSGVGEAKPEQPPAGEKQETSSEIKGGLEWRKVGVFQEYQISGREYRIGGVRPLFVTSLKVNIRGSLEGRSYYDSLELYSSKARSGFALSLSKVWGIEPVRVEKDLVMILEDLERRRDEQLNPKEKSEVRVSESERAMGLELLKDPRLFERIVEDLSVLGYVGEDLNKELLYLCASSRKLEDPISVLILSQSASGKSYLVDCVKKLMPEEEVVAVTSLSDQALNYIDDLMHKFMVLGEAVHSEVVEHQIREMLSGKELSRLVTMKDASSGKMVSRVVKTPVVVSSVMTGTNYGINPENASRCFVVNTDESKAQTLRIHEQQRRRYSLEVVSHGAQLKEKIIKRHQAAQRILEKRVIVNEFAPYLSFPVSLMRLRRDHDRFLDLIACVCFLRQYQKKIERKEGVEYISCDLEDYRIAYRIMVEGVLSSTVRELPKGAVTLYEDIRAWVRKAAKEQKVEVYEFSFTQRHVRENTGMSHTWVGMILRQLVEYEYLVQVRGNGGRSKGVYRLKGDEGIGKIDLSMIPSVEEMRGKFKTGQ